MTERDKNNETPDSREITKPVAKAVESIDFYRPIRNAVIESFESRAGPFAFIPFDAALSQEEAAEVIDSVDDPLLENEKRQREISLLPKGDQCLLIQNIKKIVRDSPVPDSSKVAFYSSGDYKKRVDIKYNHIHKIQSENPDTILNKIKSIKGAKNLLEIKPHEVSALTPTIRLFKQYYDSEGAEPREVEYKFNSFVDPIDDLQSMLLDSNQRGVGVGIKSFSYTLAGVSPATAKNDIRADLEIYAQNFNELYKDRAGIDNLGNVQSYRIIDLLFLEPKYRYLEEGDSRKQRKFNPNFYETKVVGGWAATGGGAMINSDLNAALKQTQLPMHLIVTNHSFSFNDDGSILLKISFIARIDSIMSDARSDILFDQKTKEERKIRKEVVDKLAASASKLAKNNENPCLDNEIKELKQAYNGTLEAQREASYLSLLRGLVNKNLIYTMVIDSIKLELSGEDLKGTRTIPKYEIIQALCNTGEEENISFGNIVKPGARYINYFFLGDLLAQAIDNVMTAVPGSSTELNYQKTKFLLGPLIADDFSEESGKIALSLADIPISVNLFNEFMHDKVVKRRRNSYPLMNFLRDVMRDLFFEAMAPDCVGEEKQRLLLDTSEFSVNAMKGGGDPMLEMIGTKPYLDLDAIFKEKGHIFNSLDNNLSKTYNYFLLYVFNKATTSLVFDQRTAKAEGVVSRYDRDLDYGIYHLLVGSDRGIVKKMNFSATTQKFLKEARYLERDFNPELQLTNRYNVVVSLIGNNLFFPGQRVYINPAGLGSSKLGDPGNPSSPANIAGIGGYHIIKDVVSTISSAGFNTTLSCLYESSGDGVSAEVERDEIVGEQVLSCEELKNEIVTITVALQEATGD